MPNELAEDFLFCNLGPVPVTNVGQSRSACLEFIEPPGKFDVSVELIVILLVGFTKREKVYFIERRVRQLLLVDRYDVFGLLVNNESEIFKFKELND